MSRTIKSTERLLAAVIAQTFLDKMFAREPGPRVIEAVYIKRITETYGAPESPNTHAVYYFMAFYITVNGQVPSREYTIETRRDGILDDDEMKHAAQRFVMNTPPRAGT